MMVEMEVLGVQVELPVNTPVLLLRELEGERRVLPIYIGSAEAASIHHALNGDRPERPLTHDLFVDVFDTLSVDLQRIEVTHLSHSTYYAELELVSGGEVKRVSARPSDAVALAVRSGTAVFVAEEVLDEAAHVLDDDGDEPEQLVDEFRKFIEEVSPEDFQS